MVLRFEHNWVVVLVMGMHVGCSSEPKPLPPDASAPKEWLPPVTDALPVDEAEPVTSKVTKSIRAGFLSALKKQDWFRLQSSLTDDFLMRFVGREDGERVKDLYVDIHWSGPVAKSLPKKQAVAALKAEFEQLIAFDRASWHVFEATVARGGQRSIQRAHFDAAGRLAGGRRRVMHATVTAEWVKDKLRRLSFDDVRWVQSRLATFEDVAPSAGLVHPAPHKNREFAQRLVDARTFGSGGVSIVDWNDDGFWDVITRNQVSPPRLHINDGKGGFVHPIDPFVPGSKDDARDWSALFLRVDLDGDKVPEVLGTNRTLYQVRRGRLHSKGKLTLTNPQEGPVYLAVTACDLDGDDDLDVVFGGNRHAGSVQTFSSIDSHAGLRNPVFINQGRLKFSEEGLARGVRATRHTLMAECFDFDGDGDQDLLFGSDFGANEYYENDGRGFFTARPQHPFVTGTSNSMGVSIADYDNEGTYSVALSNMYSHAGHRVVGGSKSLARQAQDQLTMLANGSTLYRYENKRYVEHGERLGINVTGWSWGNIFFDFDNDGDKDLFAVNGNLSHSDAEAPDL